MKIVVGEGSRSDGLVLLILQVLSRREQTRDLTALS